jgi:hypothetical protein
MGLSQKNFWPISIKSLALFLNFLALSNKNFGLFLNFLALPIKLCLALTHSSPLTAASFYQDFDITWGDGRRKMLNNGDLLCFLHSQVPALTNA